MRDQKKNLTNATIMMVDDEQITMEIVQTYLEDEGYSRFVLEHRSTHAMQTLEKTNPDTLFLDLIMPDKSGFEILSEIRQHPKFKHLPVIILTSSTDTESKLQALDLGATDFLAKPVDQSELLLRLRNTLGAKAYIDQLAYYDPLTNLPNKRLFQEHLDWAFNKADRHKQSLALLSISIDNLGSVNAAIGQDAGDDILRQAAQRIEKVIRESDQLANSGDKEATDANFYHTEGCIFSLFLDQIHHAQDAANVATRIMDAFKTPLMAQGSELYISLSIGIATYPSEGSTSTALIRLASSAREYVKKQGGNAFQFSSNTINRMYEKKMCMESMLRKALDRDEFILHYQPKVGLDSGRIQGVEALLRWNNGANGIISPIDFIPLAEETGLIIPIGEWVIFEACKQLSEWSERISIPINMNANLSAIQFRNKDFITQLEHAITSHKIDFQTLTLELTESLLMDDIDESIGIMRKIRDCGVKISIDDFGTGYSSLSYLSKLPANELKIDRSFVMHTPHMSDSSAIVEAIIFLAKKLGLKTIAEGVETKAQLQFLHKVHCDEYQGFLFSRPLPARNLYDIFLKKYEKHSTTTGHKLRTGT